MDLLIQGEEVNLELVADSTVVDLGVDDEEEKESEPAARVFFLSSGEMTPFELFLHYETEEDGFTIKGNELGDLEFENLKVTL